MPLNRRTLAHLLLLATALVWGATFTLVKSALADASPLLFNLLRFALATIALLLVNRKRLRAHHPRQPRRRRPRRPLPRPRLPAPDRRPRLHHPSKSAFVTGLVVVFVPGLTLIPLLRPPGTPRPGLPAAAGALLAFAGLILITTPAGTLLRDLLATIGRGDLLTLPAPSPSPPTCSPSPASPDASPPAYSPPSRSASPPSSCSSPSRSSILLSIPPRLAIALLICSLLATAAAFTIQSFAQQVLPPPTPSSSSPLSPSSASLTSILVLHEALTRRSLLGAPSSSPASSSSSFAPSARSTEIPA